MEITKKQLAYLKSLDSKKKKRKFLLDCLIENVEISEEVKTTKVSYLPINEFPFFKVEFSNPKPNYSPEEIELVKHNINQREVTEQGSELLKFDVPKKDSVNENKKLYAELISYVKNIPRYNFVSVEMAMEIEKLVLKYHENAK